MSRKVIYEAIKKTIERLVQEAKKNHDKKGKKSRLHFGRSPSLAPFFEEEFAKNLSKVFNNYDFFIDCPVSLLDKNKKHLRKQKIYPDLLVIYKKDKDYILRGIIELKLELGYLNIGKLKDNNREKNLLKSKFLIIKLKNKEEISIKIHSKPKIKKLLLVVTLKNEHNYKGKPKSPKYWKIMEKYGYEHIFLLQKNHYNDDSFKSILNELDSKKEEITKFFTGL